MFKLMNLFMNTGAHGKPTCKNHKADSQLKILWFNLEKGHAGEWHSRSCEW
jgi:hypothetical protein